MKHILKHAFVTLTAFVALLVPRGLIASSHAGLTNPIAFAAPVFVGIRDTAADLALLKSE